MSQIEIKQGSATDPQPENGRGIMIAHICNDEGKWGRGFVLAVNKISMAGKAAYQALAQDSLYREFDKSIPRGLVQIVELKPDVFVANMIAQQGVDKTAVANGCLVDYPALQQCLKTLFQRAIQLNCDVHIPAGVGSGLAGGDRTIIHQMIRAQAQEAEKVVDITDFDDEVTLTLWEFTDTSSDSFVAPSPHSVATGSPATPTTPSSVPDSILGGPTEDEL